ncbi:MAG: STAS domain-containing protein [Deltaproteobacteria bacterium]
MDIIHRTSDGISIIMIKGNMSADAIEHARSEIEGIVAVDGTELLLDLKEVEFIDSAGIGAIVYMVKRCRRSGGTVKIANVQGQVRDVFRMAGLDKALDIYTSIDTALESYPAPKRDILTGHIAGPILKKG